MMFVEDDITEITALHCLVTINSSYTNYFYKVQSALSGYSPEQNARLLKKTLTYSCASKIIQV